MAVVRAKDREGQEHSIDAASDRPLMEALRDADLVTGICGGMCSCGTCHVYVAQAWLDKLPPKGPDEEMMLEGIGELVEVRGNSRLSCQIPVADDLAGLELEIGPVA